MTVLNGIPVTPEQQLALAEQYGGLDAWGTDLVAPHYSAVWAWAGNTPFQWGKQVASHLGGIRNPMVVHGPTRTTDPVRCGHTSLTSSTSRRPSWTHRSRTAQPGRRHRPGTHARRHLRRLSADLHIPPAGVEGVIVAEADHLGGFSLFVQAPVGHAAPSRTGRRECDKLVQQASAARA